MPGMRDFHQRASECTYQSRPGLGHDEHPNDAVRGPISEAGGYAPSQPTDAALAAAVVPRAASDHSDPGDAVGQCRVPSVEVEEGEVEADDPADQVGARIGDEVGV